VDAHAAAGGRRGCAARLRRWWPALLALGLLGAAFVVPGLLVGADGLLPRALDSLTRSHAALFEAMLPAGGDAGDGAEYAVLLAPGHAPADAAAWLEARTDMRYLRPTAVPDVVLVSLTRPVGAPLRALHDAGFARLVVPGWAAWMCH